MTKIKLIFIFTAIILISLPLLGLFIYFPHLLRSLEGLFYWFCLAVILLIVWKFKLSGENILWIAWGMTITGIPLNIFKFEISEMVFRISFLFWIVGVMAVLIKYRQIRNLHR